MERTISTFEKYKLTQAEEKLAIQFTSLQCAYLHNLRTTYAEEKIALTFDPLNPHRFTQQEAELQGKIGILSYLITIAEDATHNPNLETEN